MNNSLNIGERIKTARKAKGWTGKDLAQKINRYPSQISEIEIGKKIPTIGTLELIANALDVGIGYLLYGEKRYESDFRNIFEVIKKNGSQSELRSLIWLFNVAILHETRRNQSAIEQKVKLLQKYEEAISQKKPVSEIKNELAAIDKAITETQTHIQSISPCVMEHLEISNL